jgi:hypothetical protein
VWIPSAFSIADITPNERNTITDSENEKIQILS